jgi:hypothetical protein
MKINKLEKNLSISVTPLDFSLGFLIGGTLINNYDFINFGMSLYQTFYIEPIKQEGNKNEKIYS